MKVKELIALLSQEDAEAEVFAGTHMFGGEPRLLRANSGLFVSFDVANRRDSPEMDWRKLANAQAAVIRRLEDELRSEVG